MASYIVVVGLRQQHGIPGSQTLQLAHRRCDDAVGLVLMDMLQRGGLKEAAKLGIAVAEAGGITLACNAQRAMLRFQEACCLPMGSICREVIR